MQDEYDMGALLASPQSMLPSTDDYSGDEVVEEIITTNHSMATCIGLLLPHLTSPQLDSPHLTSSPHFTSPPLTHLLALLQQCSSVPIH